MVNATARTGIPGLDGILHGGLPAGRATLVVGDPGSGKTLLGLQFLYNGARTMGEPGLLVSFEETPEALRFNATALGLPDGEADDSDVHFIDARPNLDAVRDGLFDIGGLLAIVRSTIERFRIKRLVFDGLDVLFASTGSDVAAREFRRLMALVHSESITSIVCLKPGAGESDVSRDFGLLEYAADAVIRLGYRMVDGLMQRLVRVVKIRGAGFATGEHPFLITARNGLEVAYSAPEKALPVIAAGRVSTGVAQLDPMLEGGLLRSSSTLVSGLPGTAKTTLGAAFLEAGLRRGERALLVALDEPAEQLIANVRSVGIDLAPFVASGLLRTLSLNAGAAIADEHYLTIEQAVNDFAPQLLVIDPLSALQKSGGAEIAILVVERLTELIRSRGVAAFYTAVSNTSAELEATSAHVSTIADTWIHLSFAIKGGERNRTLTIVKSRGTAHSSQLREMILSRSGIELLDVYRLEGEFLLGTARVRREQQDRQESAERAHAKLQELNMRKDAAQAKLRETERELTELDGQMVSILQQSEATVRAIGRDSG